MTSQHSDPPHEPTDTSSEVLSDATDLDVLLEALLGDQEDPLADVRTPDVVIAHAVPAHAVFASAAPEPAVVELPPPVQAVVEPLQPELSVVPAPQTLVDDEVALAPDATTDDGDAWGFVSEDPQEGHAIAPEEGAVALTVPPSLDLDRRASSPPLSSEPPRSRRTWRDKLRVSLSKQTLLVAALSAAALITASAIGLRDEPTQTQMQTLPSPEAAAPVQASSPVAGTTPVKAADTSGVEVWAAARAPEVQPRVTNRTPPRRVNEATDARTTSRTPPARVEAPRSAPTASPLVTSPARVERTTELTDRDAAPSRTASADGEPRRPADSASTDAGSGPTVANGPEPAPRAAVPAPTSAAPASVAVPRRSAARLVTGGSPEYPAALRTARIGGSVEVRFTIDSSGRVTNVQSLSGPLQLRSAAEAAVRRWRYEAARVDNVAVETQTSVRFNFDPSTDRRPQQ